MYQHTIFGAGLIGGFIGGVLRSQGHAVSMIVRPALRSRFENSLKLTDFNGSTREVNGFSFAGEADPAPDFMWLTVKCTAVENAVKTLAPFVDDKTVIICCQNGLGSDQVVKAAFPNNRVLRAMVLFNVTDIAESHLHRGSEGDITIEDDVCVRSMVEQINSSLMPVSLSTEIEAVLWAKLQLNLTNALNGLADLPIKTMLGCREYRQVAAILMRELLSVVKTKSIVLPKLTGLDADKLPSFFSLPNWLFKLLGSKMMAMDPTVKSSMWRDLKQHKITEVDYLNGAVVEAGRALGVACPANQKIVELIHEVERGERQQGMDGKTMLKEISV